MDKSRAPFSRYKQFRCGEYRGHIGLYEGPLTMDIGASLVVQYSSLT